MLADFDVLLLDIGMFSLNLLCFLILIPCGFVH